MQIPNKEDIVGKAVRSAFDSTSGFRTGNTFASKAKGLATDLTGFSGLEDAIQIGFAGIQNYLNERLQDADGNGLPPILLGGRGSGGGGNNNTRFRTALNMSNSDDDEYPSSGPSGNNKPGRGQGSNRRGGRGNGRNPRNRNGYSSGPPNGTSNRTVWQGGSGNSGSPSWFDRNRSSTQSASLVSGIKSGVLINPSQSATDDWSPLYILCGEMFPILNVPSTSLTLAAEVILNDIFSEVRRGCQMYINRNIASEFTFNGWYGYTTSVLKALQLYYMYDSILSWEDDATQQNKGIQHLVRSISPQVKNDFISLKLELSKHYVHPKAVLLIWFMYQNFKFTDTPEAPIIRLSYLDALNERSPNYDFGSGSALMDAKIALQTVNSSEYQSFMLKGFPNWQIRELPASVRTAIYSKDFNTFWHNSNVIYHDVDLQKNVNTNEVANKTENHYYGLFDKDVDGLFYALSTLGVRESDPDVSYEEPGIWKTWSDHTNVTQYEGHSSLLSYNGVLIQPPNSIYQACGSGIHNLAYYDLDTNKLTPFQCGNTCVQLAQVHSVSNLVQATNESVRWLLYPTDV